MSHALATGWKLGHPQGLRFFANAEAVEMCGHKDDPRVFPVGDFFIRWPEELGPVPAIEQLESWENEYNALYVPPDTVEQRLAKLEAKAR
jgi:hypothetical protein